METWRLLCTWDESPGVNMALDEALLFGPEQRLPTRPALRFYTWSPAALSLGYFQRVADIPACQDAQVLVRRLTGGGAIHHADELTFSIATDLSHPLYAGEVATSYARVHDALLETLGELGLEARRRGAESLASDREHTGMCFHHSSAMDVVWNGRKGIGSAQRRSKGRVLHHGSIKLGATDLEPGIAHLRESVPGLDAVELALGIQRTFAKRFGWTFEDSQPTEAELKHCEERSCFFTSERFVHRR